MTAPTRLAPWHTRFPGLLAGSLFAVPTVSRLQAACELADAGLDVHVDMMATEEGLPAGVSTGELRAIAASVASAAELHVIVDSGVTQDIAPLRVTAGVDSMVVGRALLAQSKGSTQ